MRLQLPFVQRVHHYAWHESDVSFLLYAAAFLGKKSSLQLQHQIIHSPPLHLGGATGSWWSGSAKHPNWRRQCAAGGNQLGQMPPPPPCHVFWAGQRRMGGSGWKWEECQEILIWCQPDAFWHAVRFPSHASMVVYKKTCLRSLSLSPRRSYNPVPNYRKVAVHCFTSRKIVQV